MATWGSHGLRGSTLEDMLNRTNEVYRLHSLALIQKIPTPVTPVEMNPERQITLAYFEKKSTVDYIGAVQSVPVCFDAKECAGDTFPLRNVHAHQLEFMELFEKQGGIAFFIIFYTGRNEIYYMPLKIMQAFVKRQADGGRKSFVYDELLQCIKDETVFPVIQSGKYLCHYLPALSRDLEIHEKNAL